MDPNPISAILKITGLVAFFGILVLIKRTNPFIRGWIPYGANCRIAPTFRSRGTLAVSATAHFAQQGLIALC